MKDGVRKAEADAEFARNAAIVFKTLFWVGVVGGFSWLIFCGPR